MSLSPIRSDLGPAPFQRTVTAAAAQVVLCNGSNTPIAANPLGINHPPSQVLVVPLAAGGSVVWLDLAGTSNTLVIEAATGAVVPFLLPGTIQSIEAGTTSNFKFVVAWHPEP